jgi:hypothetical protein
MIPHLFYYHLVVLGLLWLCILLHDVWPRRGAMSPPRPVEPEPLTPQRQRSNEPKPFAGLTHKPHCVLCEQEATHPKPQPPIPPDLLPPTNRRPRGIDKYLVQV